MSDYIKKTKPIAVEKERRRSTDSSCLPKELKSVRGLTGAMQWPVAQGMLHGAPSMSILRATVSSLMVTDLLEANKMLRFLKENGDISLRYQALCEIHKLR